MTGRLGNKSPAWPHVVFVHGSVTSQFQDRGAASSPRDCCCCCCCKRGRREESYRKSGMRYVHHLEINGILLLIVIITCSLIDLSLCKNDFLVAFEEYEQDCPGWETRTLPELQVPWGIPHRAFLTVPPGVSIQSSVITGAALGAIAWTFIPRYTWLGQYEGEVVTDSSKISHYTWQVRRNYEPDYLIDGHDVATSNWLRFLNCSRDCLEENVEAMECYGKIYYISTKDIYPGKELLIYYGDNYARELGVDVEKYHNSPHCS